MSNSYSEVDTFTCGYCRKVFLDSIWLIVDVVERPGLWSRFLNGQLNHLICPHCGDDAPVNVPVLLFHRQAEKPLRFILSEHLSDHENRDQFAELSLRLKITVGDVWEKAWTESIEGVWSMEQFQALPAWPESIEEREGDEPLREALEELVFATSWSEVRELLDLYPALLSENAIAALESTVDKVNEKYSEEMSSRLVAYRNFLQRCREVGLTKALVEEGQNPGSGLPLQEGHLSVVSHAVRAFVNAPTWQESRDVFSLFEPVLLRKSADRSLIALMLRFRGNGKIIRLIEQHRKLLARCRLEGVDTAFAQYLRLGWMDKQKYRILVLINLFTNAKNWCQRVKALAESAEDLLSDEADLIIAEFIRRADDSGDVTGGDSLKFYRQVLAECRSKGIDVALQSDPSYLSEVRVVVQNYLNAQTRSDARLIVLEGWPLLLGAAAEQAFARMQAKYQYDAKARDLLSDRLALINECRRVGIERAFAQHPLFGGEIAQALFAYLDSETEDEAMRIVETYAEFLLTDEAFQRLAALSELAGASGDAAEADLLERRLELLKRCRQEGIEDAFLGLLEHQKPYADTVKELIGARDWAATKEIITRNQTLLLADETDRLLVRLIARAANSGELTPLLPLLEKNRALLTQCRQDGIEAVFAVHKDEKPQVGEIVAAFIRAETWEDTKAVVERHQDILLPAEADAFLLNLAKDMESGQAIESLEELRQLLTHCRTEGIDAAFAPYLRPRALINTVEAFTNAKTWEESKEIVLNNWLELQNEQLDAVFTDFYRRFQNDPEITLFLQEHFNLLRRCREVGVDQAFIPYEGVTKTGPDEPEIREVFDILDELLHLTKTEDSPRGIILCQQALSLLDSEKRPELWATVKRFLGECLTRSPIGDRAKNIEEALGHFKDALKIHQPQEFPREWAEIQESMGRAYNRRVAGGRADNIEEAIASFRGALEIQTRDQAPVSWAELHNLLGIAFTDRIRGERTDNIERALRYLQQGLEVYTKEAHPQGWAKLTYNLGNAYSQRLNGKKDENLRTALACYQETLAVRTKEAMPEYWAQTQLALGQVYQHLGESDRAGELELAINHLQRAIEVYTPETFPMEWAATQISLSLLYRHRITGEPEANIEKALECLQLALTVYQRDQWPEQWSAVQNNLAQTYRDRLIGERQDNLSQAASHFIKTLEVLNPQQFPVKRQIALIGLGSLYTDMDNWQAALTCYLETIEIGEQLFGVAYTEPGRHTEVAETTRVYHEAAYCLARLERFDEALVLIEKGKTRLLAQTLTPDIAEDPRIPEPLQERLQTLQEQVRWAEYEMALPRGTWGEPDYLQASELLADKRRELAKLLQLIRNAAPSLRPATLDLADILALAPRGGALVIPLFALQGGFAFVVPADTKHLSATNVVQIDELNNRRLMEIFSGGKLHSGWMGSYIEFLAHHISLEQWMQQMESLNAQLWNLLIEPIYRNLRELGVKNEGARIVMLLPGELSVLPLHLAWRLVDGAPRRLLDDFTISYAPSAYVLDMSQQKLITTATHLPSLLLVTDPTADLPFASIEGDEIEHSFGPTNTLRFEGVGAEPQAIIQLGWHQDYLHFACHVSINWSNMRLSGFILANDHMLTLSDIVTVFDLDHIRLATLSACESGLIDFGKTPNESIGLPVAFLQIGAPAVVSSLWEVNDFSTFLLMGEFYRRHLSEGLGIAEALRGAQLWLRDLTRSQVLDRIEPVRECVQSEDPALFRALDGLYWRLLEDYNDDDCPFAHPYYWGAFTASGAV